MKKVIGTLFVTAAAFVFGRFYQILCICSEKGNISERLSLIMGEKDGSLKARTMGKLVSGLGISLVKKERKINHE